MKIATRLTLGFALIILFICLQGAAALVKSSAVASGFPPNQHPRHAQRGHAQ